ncbi:MAG: peptide chain release factor N(5)-glutamine methyltransferase [Spirochaetales bacterium]
MTIREALFHARDLFRQQGIENPFLDSLVLLSACTGMAKAKILEAYGKELTREEEDCFQEAVHRRLSGLPVSYILRKKEFFGLSFYVDERVLVPRPDTETLVETVLRILEEDTSVRRIHDTCTGSGCIPISVVTHLPETAAAREVEVSASDVSEAALEVFRINCLRILGYILPHTLSDLLSSVKGPFDLITANPPYIESSEVDRMMGCGWPEPRLALDGGEDGMKITDRLILQAVERLRENGYLLIEGADSQAEAIQQKMYSHGYSSVEILHDLAGRKRVVVGRKG